MLWLLLLVERLGILLFHIILTDLIAPSLLNLSLTMFIATRQIPPESAAQQPSTLRAEIEREKETVNEKREKVLEAASEMMKKSKFDGVSGSDRTPGYEGGAFDGSIKNITGKLTKVAHDLNKTSKAVKSRLQSLQSTVEEVESEWKSKAGSKKASSKGQASPERVVADSLTGSSKSAPLNRLHQHLNR